jgi:hypothetical protein
MYPYRDCVLLTSNINTHSHTISDISHIPRDCWSASWCIRSIPPRPPWSPVLLGMDHGSLQIPGSPASTPRSGYEYNSSTIRQPYVYSMQSNCLYKSILDFQVQVQVLVYCVLRPQPTMHLHSEQYLHTRVTAWMYTIVVHCLLQYV